MPIYVKEALTNGTKNIKELYEFDRIPFDGGYQAQVYRGNNFVVFFQCNPGIKDNISSRQGKNIASGKPVVLKVSSRVSLRPDYEAYRQIGITKHFAQILCFLFAERMFFDQVRWMRIS